LHVAHRKPLSEKGYLENPFSQQCQKTTEKRGFSHFMAIRRNLSKRPEMPASGSKYYRSIPPLPGEARRQ